MRRDEGAAVVEFGAALPVVLFLILLCFEALMASMTVERVENAARVGARAAGQGHEHGACPAAAYDAMPGWLNGKTVTAGGGAGEVACTVHARVPLLFPGVPFDFAVDRTVTMPMG